MKIIQNLKPIVDVSGIEIVIEYCCEESMKKRSRDYIVDRLFDKILSKNDIIYKFCPYCGEETEIINNWPMPVEVRTAIKHLIDKCQCFPGPIYDALSNELKRKSAHEIEVNENAKKNLELLHTIKLS